MLDNKLDELGGKVYLGADIGVVVAGRVVNYFDTYWAIKSYKKSYRERNYMVLTIVY